MATTDFITTVRNTSGSTRRFGFLGPRGVELSPDEDYQLVGGLFGGTMSAPAKKALLAALNSGALTVTSSPKGALADTQTGAVKVVKVTNGTVGVADPGTGAFIAFPGYTSITPAANATSIATNTTVAVVFSEAIVAASTTLTLTKRTGSVAVTGTTAYNSGTKTLTFTPGGNLTSANIYDAALSAVDASGHTFTLSWSFTTA